VAGICDTSSDALAQAARDQGVSKDALFTDWREMFDRLAPECVIIATTAPSHCDLTCAASEAGARWVLCEKPMAISLSQCDRMIDVCRRHGTALAINHQMRFMEQYTVPKEIIDSPEFGELRSVTVVAGNFGLSMNGIHYFEMFRFMSGEQPREVTAWFSADKVPNPRGSQFEDRAGAVRLTTISGRRFYLDCGADQGHGMQVIYGGRFGQLFVDELYGSMSMAVREEKYRDLATTRYGMPARRTTRSLAPADVIAPSAAVLQSLIDNRNYPTGEDGRQAVSVLVGAYLSDELGRTVTLDGDPLPRQRTFPWA
jgi:predicted dehydrogenase